MNDPTTSMSTSPVELLQDVDTETLETFVHRYNNGAYDDSDIDELTAAVTAVENLLEETAEDSGDHATTPSEAKWAAAAGNEDGLVDSND